MQQQKTRKRRGSLRKVALLGRGAEREKREGTSPPLEASNASTKPVHTLSSAATFSGLGVRDALGLTADNIPHSLSTVPDEALQDDIISPPAGEADRKSSYTSTTDEEDVLQIPPPSNQIPHAASNVSSGSESYFAARGGAEHPRSFQPVKSPLSYSGIASTSLPQADADWDYSETEWWGWVVLVVTWFVFIVGMGSSFGVWSWAWDVGKTPYAPPELEDDPTLPVVGYYPALIILTGVMAWVWVVVAWVGMKYFRHAKISGD